MRAGSSASLTLTLSEAAKLSIKLERKSTGRKVGKSCVTATHANRKRKVCTRYTSVGSAVKKSGLNGANTLKLATTVGPRAEGRQLPPDDHRDRRRRQREHVDADADHHRGAAQAHRHEAQALPAVQGANSRRGPWPGA